MSATYVPGVTLVTGWKLVNNTYSVPASTMWTCNEKKSTHMKHNLYYKKMHFIFRIKRWILVGFLLSQRTNTRTMTQLVSVLWETLSNSYLNEIKSKTNIKFEFTFISETGKILWGQMGLNIDIHILHLNIYSCNWQTQ